VSRLASSDRCGDGNVVKGRRRHVMQAKWCDETEPHRAHVYGNYWCVGQGGLLKQIDEELQNTTEWTRRDRPKRKPEETSEEAT
jgi:hypothetical protein